MKKVYLKGVNVVVTGFSQSDVYIPTRSARMQPESSHVVITDKELNQRYNINWVDLRNGDGDPFATINDAIDYLAEFIGSFKFAGTGGGTPATIYDITALNYTELITNNVTGEFVGQVAYVQNPQGNSFWPGSLGGSFYDEGLYLWNGAIWSGDDNAIASQVYQNIQDLTGINNQILQEITDRTNGDQGLQNQITLNDQDIQNIFDSLVKSSTQWSTIIANFTLSNGFFVNLFTAFLETDKVASGTTSFDEYFIINDGIIVPYIGRPYEGLRITHLIRINLNINTGSRQNLRLELRRIVDDSLIGSAIKVNRNPDETGVQEILMTYTSSATDAFVTNGFYIALINESGANIVIGGDIGLLITNIFEKPLKF